MVCGLIDREPRSVRLLTWAQSDSNGFMGIETKCHETLSGWATMKPRYTEVAQDAQIFTLAKPAKDPSVERGALLRIWLDHLLELSMMQSKRWEKGLFVLAHPQDNEACTKATTEYRAELKNASTFDSVSLESVVEAIRAETDAAWADTFYNRYLDQSKIDRALKP